MQTSYEPDPQEGRGVFAFRRRRRHREVSAPPYFHHGQCSAVWQGIFRFATLSGDATLDLGIMEIMPPEYFYR